MRFIILLLVLTAAANAQVIRYYKPGQTSPLAENSGLLLKHNRKKVFSSADFRNYSRVKTVKFVSFNSRESQLDSVLKMVSRQLTPHTIIFEDCDLNELSIDLDIFPQLTSLSITKHSSYFENTLLASLSKNKLRKLSVQTEDEEFIMDSLHLLKYLEVLDISSNHLFKTPNKTDKHLVSVNGITRAVMINYYGALYRNYKEPVNTAHAPESAAPSNPLIAHPVGYKCINQPLPGININDTLYRLVSQNGGSFIYESGSEITFDKHAFLNADGSVYTGEVGIFYREFRNPVEIMLSGIPMVVKESGEHKIFKSGGMYEINAVDKSGNQLRTRNDSVIKINFALTDTSAEFKFYSLDDSGKWEVASNTVASKAPTVSKINSVRTKAIDEYVNYLFRNGRQNNQDTTPFYDRFEDQNYLYSYRKDNMKHWKDTTKYEYFGYNVKKARGVFRIKYVARTKDNEIVFTVVPCTWNYYSNVPKHVRPLTNRYFIYSGSLDRQQFKEKFCKNKGYWDLRTGASGSEISFRLKTDNGFIELSAQLAAVYNGKYVPQDARGLQVRVDWALAHEAKKFKRKLNNRWHPNDNNRIDPFLQWGHAAWTHSRQFQNEKEKAMDFRRWQIYVMPFMPRFDSFERLEKTTVGSALVQSGLGIKNIDTYIHNSQMEPVFVQYRNAVPDSTGTEYHAMLYKSINTSYPLVSSSGNSELQGYYFKNRPNYIIRFSERGFMQVTKPTETKSSKEKDKITLDFKEEFYVKDMNSAEITKLILN